MTILRTVAACVCGAVWILSAAVCSAQTPPEYDRYGGITSITGSKTGWFHVEEIGGRWFFVTPEGHAFFSLGATHAVECMHLDELNLFEMKYGKSEETMPC